MERLVIPHRRGKYSGIAASSSGFSNVTSASSKQEISLSPIMINFATIFVKPMQPHLNKWFGLLDNSLNSMPVLFANASKSYQVLMRQLGPGLDAAAVNVYKHKVIMPLRRLSVAASIPAPAEKLQSLTQPKDIWKECTRMFMPSVGELFNDL